MNFDTLLVEWKRAAVSGAYSDREYEVATESDYIRYCTMLDAARTAGIAKGYKVRSSGANVNGGRYIRISLGNARLAVSMPDKTKRAQAVTGTSRAAYAAIPKETDVQRYVRAGIAAGPGFSDADIAMSTGWARSTVSGRRNDVVNAGAVIVDGVEYKVRLYGTKRDPGTKMTVRTYEIFCTKAASSAHQLEMFKQ